MKIKVKTNNSIEDELCNMGVKLSHARTIGAVMRGVAGDIINERNDEITFCVKGVIYKLTIRKE